jgi:hypothetical protein
MAKVEIRLLRLSLVVECKSAVAAGNLLKRILSVPLRRATAEPDREKKNSRFNLSVNSFDTQEVGREYERFGKKRDSDLNRSSHVKYVFEQTAIAFDNGLLTFRQVHWNTGNASC